MSTFRRLNLLTIALCFVVIVFGAYVRLSDAGLGCPDWPGCYGHLGVPSSDQHVAEANAAYPERPVEAHKGWKEMIHRYIASTLGLLIVALALLSLRLRGQGAPKVLPWVLVGLVIFQGVLGMWTVTWQLKPLVVTGHLLGGLTTLSLLAWMWLSSRPSRGQAGPPLPGWLRKLAALGLVAVAVQIFLGGWTSTNYAALACPDLPTCHGRWLPETDYREAYTLWRGLGINYEYGVLDNRARVTIHFTHRLGAILLSLILVSLALALIRRGGHWYRYGHAVIGALALQVLIGLSVVHWQLPLLLADAHNAGAAVLLLSLVALNHAVFGRRHD
ncbi:heme A synthase [Stagnimonas aquatica]|uniref:Heme A synthase n=1 Tax=Stagnimonas aquatica TaxID=2689987 RepID=A0A3N0VGB6_9GAMM|nr:COX15/CtaA family protein [Stagnimonas aquatica]ROH91809.1 heme A synthase [Stagnimonas aquatica]